MATKIRGNEQLIAGSVTPIELSIPVNALLSSLPRIIVEDGLDGSDSLIPGPSGISGVAGSQGIQGLPGVTLVAEEFPYDNDILSCPIDASNIAYLNKANTFTASPQKFDIASTNASIQIGTRGVWQAGASFTNILDNAYYDGSDYRYLTTSHATLFQISHGLTFYVAPSGIIGDVVTFAPAINISDTGSLGLNGGSAQTYSILYWAKTFTLDNTQPWYGLNSGVVGAKISSAFTKYMIGAVAHCAIGAANTQNWSGDGIHVPHVGMWAQVDSEVSATGTILESASVNAIGSFLGGTITKWSGVRIGTPTIIAPAVVTTAYGLYIDPIIGGGTNYAIYAAGGNSFLGGKLSIDVGAVALIADFNSSAANGGYFTISRSGVAIGYLGDARTISSSLGRTNNDFDFYASGNLYLGGSGGYIIFDDKVGVGLATPTAALHLKAGTIAASTAPLKFSAGVNMTTPEFGSIECTDDGTTGHLYVTLRVATVVTRIQIA